MAFARKPLLCLDTNASIDIGVVIDLQRKGESLYTLGRRIDKSWKNVFYGEATTLQARHDQLRATARFLRMARRQSDIRLPAFATIEHARVRSDAVALPPFREERITPEVHRLSLEIFSETALSLQDSLILVSAMGMRADALVSNDDDFKRAFSENAGRTALRVAGKPLLLLDHRESAAFKEKERPTLHTMILQSLRRYYRAHPRLGRPLWVARRDGKRDWYLAYHQLLPAGGIEGMEPVLVPGRDSISIIDERWWTVCKIGNVHFKIVSYPEGVSEESIERTKEFIEHPPKDTDKRQWESVKRSLKMPEGGKTGYVRVAITLDGFPPFWRGWNASADDRDNSKRKAPKNALGFVETGGQPS